MGLTDKQKAVIENDFNEKDWNAYKIWKEHPRFECSGMTVHNLIKKIKETGSTERRKGSDRPVTATAEENVSMNFKNKSLKLRQMNSACRKRRSEPAGKLLQHFSIDSLPRLVFQDEKDFSLQEPTNR